MRLCPALLCFAWLLTFNPYECSRTEEFSSGKERANCLSVASFRPRRMKIPQRGNPGGANGGCPSFGYFSWASKKSNSPGGASPADSALSVGEKCLKASSRPGGRAPRRRLTLFACPKRVSRKRAPNCPRPPRAGSLRCADVLGPGKNSPFGLKQFAGLFPKTSTPLRRGQYGRAVKGEKQIKNLIQLGAGAPMPSPCCLPR